MHKVAGIRGDRNAAYERMSLDMQRQDQVKAILAGDDKLKVKRERYLNIPKRQASLREVVVLPKAVMQLHLPLSARLPIDLPLTSHHLYF